MTIILTACDRVDLLKITLESFFTLNTHRIDKFHVHNDGDDSLFADLIEKYPNITWHFSGERIGLAKSLDYLMKFVNDEYYFTCEDDWLFSGNRNFISESLVIIENNPDINQVWIRRRDDHGHPLGDAYTLNNIAVRDVAKQFQHLWGGFTFNPSLRRLSDYKKYFPNGYAKHGDEIDCNNHVEKIGYRAVSLVDAACIHNGFGRHTEGFKV